MSSRVVRKTTDPLEILERALNKTTLTTQKVGHGEIIEIGGRVYERVSTEHSLEKCSAVDYAVAVTKSKTAQEKREALLQLEREKDEEKRRELEKKQQHFEKLAARVKEQRDAFEAERLETFRLEKEKEKEEALRSQWEECEELKDTAVKEACAALTKRLRNEVALEKELAIAAAMADSREKFKQRLERAIQETREQCESLAAEEAERVAMLHASEIDRLNKRYEALVQQHKLLVDQKQRVEGDFKGLQDDYRRFMNYTDGQYHSDYMMLLRDHGLTLANQHLSSPPQPIRNDVKHVEVENE